MKMPPAILFGPEALEYRLANSAMVIAITDASRYDTLRALLPGLPALARVIGCGTGDRDVEFWQLL
jgi:acetyl-CoA synthetase